MATIATVEEKEAIQKIVDECDCLLKKIEDNKNRPDSPNSGDTKDLMLWMAIIFISGGYLITFSIKKRREGYNR